MLDIDLDGSRRIWPAHVGCRVGPDRSRRIQTNRLDDHRDDQEGIRSCVGCRCLASDTTAVAVAAMRRRHDDPAWRIPMVGSAAGGLPFQSAGGDGGQPARSPSTLDRLLPAAHHLHHRGRRARAGRAVWVATDSRRQRGRHHRERLPDRPPICDLCLSAAGLHRLEGHERIDGR
jgi:hypothetical protein